ncbi:MAG: nucleoside triphosphate pyrophosphohydrolase [Methylococcales symbiont of Hymedesmia sp. n. MRB-2018]|nr:MAG: nucleoside triphosphate pyrophosphohydrolase [Methylococcales symbiont of Hymedesmia sp. n. MRB-2018]KAF3983974.1 MAG: nucleoside triphosphate pyrophosphohydrolase [Methylococcales symbiont of Hymedesmia sp. n. MRB-2018]
MTVLTQTQKLLGIMAKLRDPEKGCSWDLKQDFNSLIPYTIEEAYEVVDAIERNDLDDLRSELGDLLLQVVFHSQIADEQGLFDFEQVAEVITDKLISRHPHIFSEARYKNADEQKKAWDQLKEQERVESKKYCKDESVLSGVAINLPALIYCEKVQDKAANHGFDWPETAPVFDKVLEELEEVKEAWGNNDQIQMQEELGDLLLVTVNLARHLKINPELALKQATQKFTRRFNYIEQQVAASSRKLRDCELVELDAYWDEAKIVLKTKD